jgi:hypothetical protein
MAKYFSYIWKMLIIVDVTFFDSFFNNYANDHGPGYGERAEPVRLRYKKQREKNDDIKPYVRHFAIVLLAKFVWSYIRNAIFIYCGNGQLSVLFISNCVMYAQPIRFS